MSGHVSLACEYPPHVRRAVGIAFNGRKVAAGCLLTIDSDAHRTEELAGIAWGVTQARRAWVEPAVVANTWSREALLAWVAGKPGRVSGAAGGVA